MFLQDNGLWFGQLDYLLFSCGTAYMLLAVLLALLAQDRRDTAISWRFLALAAMLVGLSRGVDMLSLVTGYGKLFMPVDLGLSVLGFGVLLGFAIYLQKWLGLRGPGPWLLLVFIIPTLGVLALGSTESFGLAHHLMAVPGYLWVSVLLVTHGDRWFSARRVCSLTAALALLLLAVAMLFTPDAAPYFPSSFFNHHRFRDLLPFSPVALEVVAILLLSLAVRCAARESSRGPRSPRRQRLSERLLIPTLLAIMVAGWIAANWFGSHRLEKEKTQLRDLARTAAAGLDLADVEVLVTNPQAGETDAYSRVRSRLIRFGHSSPLLSLLYLLKDDSFERALAPGLTWLADSEPEESPLHGVPGELIPVPHGANLEALWNSSRTGQAIVGGPMQNLAGTWFAAAAPLRDQSGRVMAHLVVVSEAHHFLEPVALNPLWVILTTMLLGSLMLLFYVAQKQNRRDALVIAAAEENYRALFTRMIDGFSLQRILLDAQGKPVDFIFLEVNPAFEKMLNLPADQVVGKRGLEVFPGIAARWVDRYGEVAITGVPAHFEDYSAALGRHFEVAAYQPAPGQFACIFTDVTDRRRTQAHMRLLAQAMEQTAEAILITDARGVIHYVNQAFTRITGYTAAEVLGKPPSILASGHHQERFFDDIFLNVRSGGTWSGRIVNRRKDGSLYTEDCTISPVEGESGRPEFFVEVKRDISKELALEEQFHQVQRLESVGRLAAGVAHDLNNLLSPVLGYSELLLDDLPAESQNRQLAGEIHKAAGRSRDLIRQLLAFSRKQVLSLKTLDLRDAILGLENLLRRTLREDIHMELKLEDCPCLVSADRGKLEQVLMNLVVNAQDAMPSGGFLSLGASRVTLDEDFCKTHGGTRPGDYILLSVSDTGMGIDEETGKHIFEPFFTTKTDLGTGLGLATVYGIVKQHGGNIWFHSKPHQGTSFLVYLPESKTELPTPTATALEPERAPGSEVVLVVEDNEMVRNLALSILRRNGYTVLGASGGAEARRLLEEHRSRLDLLISDVVMPDLDGKQVYQLVADKHPGVKVLFMSGYTRNVITQSGILEPGVAFVQKPFSVQELLSEVRNALDGVASITEENP